MWKIKVTYYEGNLVVFKVFDEADAMRIVTDGPSLRIEEAGEMIASFSTYISVIKEQVND